MSAGGDSSESVDRGFALPEPDDISRTYRDSPRSAGDRWRCELLDQVGSAIKLGNPASLKERGPDIVEGIHRDIARLNRAGRHKIEFLQFRNACRKAQLT